MMTGEEEEAVGILNKLRRSSGGSGSVTNKLVLQKLAIAYSEIDNLESASSVYEELYNLDRRDFKTALEIVKVNNALGDFGKAMKWAEEAIKIAPDNGETIGAKGNVYYAAFQDCRENFPTNDDKLVAAFAYNYFKMAEDKGQNRYKRDRIYLENNRDDLVFGKADWFMLDEDVKRKGSISPKSECYAWVSESIKKDPSWN
jgi:tetratricopeptide (TPR) repeat protein